MTIDTGALVEPLAYAICAEQDRRCACAEIPADYRLPCEDAERSARAAIAYLLPLIVERCAEEAGRQNLGMYDHSGAVAAAAAILALIPKGGK